MSGPSIDIAIHHPDWEAKLPGLQAISKKAIAKPLEGKTVEVSLVFTNDAEIQTLNKQHRDKDKPTNVLSFPQEPEDYESGLPLGDVVLALETIEAEAEAANIPLENHVAHLLVHGVLHLLGYDHNDDPAAARMEQFETEILESLGYPDPYSDDRK